MRAVKGMVMKTTEDHLFLVTPDGEYLKTPLVDKNLLPGEEIEVELPDIIEKKQPKISSLKKYIFSLAAAFLLLIMSFSIFSMFFSDKAVAYLALDVNPSLELSLNKKGYVIKTSALNKDAEKVLKNISVKNMYYSEAVKKVIDEIENLNFLTAEKENIIQITLAAEENYEITADEIETVLTDHIKNKKITADYSITKTNLAERETAKNQNIHKELNKSPDKLYKKYNKHTEKDNNIKKENNKNLNNTNKSNPNTNKTKKDENINKINQNKKKSSEKQKISKPKNNNNNKLTKENKSEPAESNNKNNQKHNSNKKNKKDNAKQEQIKNRDKPQFTKNQK